jgi:hypothetical protein
MLTVRLSRRHKLPVIAFVAGVVPASVSFFFQLYVGPAVLGLLVSSTILVCFLYFESFERENERIAREDRRIALESERLKREDERLKREDERLKREDERLKREDERLKYEKERITHQQEEARLERLKKVLVELGFRAELTDRSGGGV